MCIADDEPSPGLELPKSVIDLRATERIGAALLGGAALAFMASAAMAGSSPAPFVSGPPLAHTGGFGEPTCHACHNELELDHPDAGRLRVEGLPERYAPGHTYLLTVHLVSEGMERAGFEIAVRFAGGPPPGRQAGALRSLDDRVHVAYLGLTPVFYAYHTRPGSAVGEGDATSWTFEWSAPPSKEPVVFDVSANSANGDDSPLGDFVLTRSDTLAGTP